MKINILILNYNGKEILKECLLSIVEAAKNSKYNAKVAILDNCSTDDSISFLKQAFPSVSIYIANENKVYCSYNHVLSEIDEDLVVLLNNDMKVEKDFLDPLVEMFKENKDAFVVGPKCLDFSKTKYEGARAKPFFRLGVFSAISRYPGYKKDIDRPGLTMQAAFGLFDRKKLLLLGGFDELYLPGLMEDADVCYRAYKYGFRCYYQPKSVIYHKGQVSFKKFYKDRNRLILAHRNSFLFMWKNISDPFLLTTHILFIPLKIFIALIRGKTEIAFGFAAAFKKIKYALNCRKKAKILFRKSDRSILREVNTNLVSAV